MILQEPKEPPTAAIRIRVAAPAVARWSDGRIRRVHPDGRVPLAWPVEMEFVLDRELRLLLSRWRCEDLGSPALPDLLEPEPESGLKPAAPAALRFLLQDAVALAAREEIELPSSPAPQLRASFGVGTPAKCLSALEGAVDLSLIGRELFTSSHPAARRLAFSLIPTSP